MGLETGHCKHVIVDLLITSMCVLPTLLSAACVYWIRNGSPDLGSGDVAVSVSGTLIAFTVTFRSSQSYNRWFEGRSSFGRIHAGCRALALYVNGAVTKLADDGKLEEASELAKSTRLLLLGLIRSTILHLRGNKCNESLKEFLEVPEDLSEEEACLQSKGYHMVQNCDAARPMVLFQLLIARLAHISSQYGGSDYRMVLTEYSDMVAAFNSADKLCNTPSPNLFMYLLCFVYLYFNWYLFPVMMANFAHDDYYMATLVTFFVCYFFGLLVVIAIDMDNPFDGGLVDLPIEKYEAGLRKDMDMILADEHAQISNPLHSAAAEAQH